MITIYKLSLKLTDTHLEWSNYELNCKESRLSYVFKYTDNYGFKTTRYLKKSEFSKITDNSDNGYGVEYGIFCIESNLKKSKIELVEKMQEYIIKKKIEITNILSIIDY